MDNNRDVCEGDQIDDQYSVKNVAISVAMLARRHLPATAAGWTDEKIFEKLNRITHVRLDREHIRQIENLEILGDRVTNLYLQQNCIEVVENLGCLRSLLFLTLAGNKISNIKGVGCLPRLAFLDLSDNYIDEFDTEELPTSLKLVNLKGNPCTRLPDYRLRLVSRLESLQQLDLTPVTSDEQRAAGRDVSSGSDDSHSDDDDDDDDDQPLSQLTDTFSSMATDILVRSQARLEEMWRHHEDKLKTILSPLAPSGDQDATKNKDD